MFCVNCGDVFAGKCWGKQEEQSFSGLFQAGVSDSVLVLVCVKPYQCFCRGFVKTVHKFTASFQPRQTIPNEIV